MAILDQFGRQISYKAARAAQDTRYRPYEPVEKKDISDLVPALDQFARKIDQHALNPAQLEPPEEQADFHGCDWVGRFFGHALSHGGETPGSQP